MKTEQVVKPKRPLQENMHYFRPFRRYQKRTKNPLILAIYDELNARRTKLKELAYQADTNVKRLDDLLCRDRKLFSWTRLQKLLDILDLEVVVQRKQKKEGEVKNEPHSSLR